MAKVTFILQLSLRRHHHEQSPTSGTFWIKHEQSNLATHVETTRAVIAQISNYYYSYMIWCLKILLFGQFSPWTFWLYSKESSFHLLNWNLYWGWQSAEFIRTLIWQTGSNESLTDVGRMKKQDKKKKNWATLVTVGQVCDSDDLSTWCQSSLAALPMWHHCRQHSLRVWLHPSVGLMKSNCLSGSLRNLNKAFLKWMRWLGKALLCLYLGMFWIPLQSRAPGLLFSGNHVNIT